MPSTAVAAALAAAEPALAETWKVGANAPAGAEYSCMPTHGSWCRTIGEALRETARHPGPDYISVDPGTYRENVVIAAGNDVRIVGSPRAQIVAVRQGTFAVRMHTGTLLRMTVVNAGSGYAPAVGLGGAGELDTWPVLDQVSIASPRAQGGALVLNGPARIVNSTIVASARGNASAVRITSTGTTAETYAHFANCTISGGRAIWIEADDGRTSRRLTGWWNTIHGTVLQESGQVRLLESLLDGTLNARAHAYQLRPRVRLGAASGTEVSSSASLDSVTMAARGASPLDVSVVRRGGNDSARVMLENALLWRPDAGPVVELATSTGLGNNTIRFTLQNALFAGPRASLRQTGRTAAQTVELDELLNTADPHFVNPDRGNFHLQPTSLAVDRGQPGSVAHGEPDLDLDRNPRVQGGRRDLGAYELTP